MTNCVKSCFSSTKECTLILFLELLLLTSSLLVEYCHADSDNFGLTAHVNFVQTNPDSVSVTSTEEKFVAGLIVY